MKRVIPVLLGLLCFSQVCSAACPKQIEAFYSAYMHNMLQDDSKNEALCETFLTEGLAEKLHRVGNATGSDPILRAQDMNEDAIETLTVQALGGDWYRVSYLWKKGDESTRTEIPLKAQETGGRCRITYITPIWHGARYGDELLAAGDGAATDIDQTSGASFLKSFYDAYTALYCRMPEDLHAKLASLRSRFLSQQALEQFRDAESENEKDGLDGYDLLIGNFDFDCLWRRSLHVEPLAADDYRVSYENGVRVCETTVSVKRRDGGYVIDGFPGDSAR